MQHSVTLDQKDIQVLKDVISSLTTIRADFLGFIKYKITDLDDREKLMTIRRDLLRNVNSIKYLLNPPEEIIQETEDDQEDN